MATISHPPGPYGPMSKNQLLNDYLPTGEGVFWIGLVTGTFLGGVVTGIAASFGMGIFLSLLFGAAVVWTIFSGFYFVGYAASSGFYGGSMIWLPWRQPWAWKFLAFTLPWILFWVISLIRLGYNWNRVKDLRVQGA